ncbi:hypothetical protein BDK51DRAFT_52584, partial [Blyttiomyces helicus]
MPPPPVSKRHKRTQHPTSTISTTPNLNTPAVDFVNALLSDELILSIFSLLSHRDLSRCLSTSKGWRRLAVDRS